MSRFFASADSQSESEYTESDFTHSEDDSEFNTSGASLSETDFSGSEEEGSGDEEMASREQEPVRKSRFLFGSDEDSDEDDSGMRVVKSQRAKIEETLNASIAALRELSEEGSWIECQKELDDFSRNLSKNVLKGVPGTVFIDMESLGEAFVTMEIDRKNMPALEFKSYTAVKQKLRKLCAEHADRISTAKNAGSLEAATVAAVAKKSVESTEIDDESPLAKLKMVLQAKGKRGADRLEKVNSLKALLTQAADDFFKAQTLIALLTAELELPNTHHDLEHWRLMVAHANQLIQLLPGLLASPNIAEYEGLPTVASLRGTLLSFALRLDDNFLAQLQDLDPHTKDYSDFLRELVELVKLLDAAAACFSKLELVDFEVQVQSKLLDHLSHLPVEELGHYGFSDARILTLCKALYQNAPESIKVKTLLNHVYFLGVNDQINLAKDLLVSSKLPENIHSMDAASQIMYNRCLAAIGLASFRLGQIRETYFLLQDLCSSGRPKELLGQGSTQHHRGEKSEQERASPKHIPLHQHINIELLDSVFLTASMILEIPLAIGSISKITFPEKRSFQSRHLKRLIDGHDRNLFHGPPENNREHIVAATKCLSTGDWRKCYQLIAEMELWNQFPARYTIKDTLKSKIRLSGFYCQLFAYSGAYTSLDVSHLDPDFADLVAGLPSRPDFPDFEKYFTCSQPGFLVPKFREADQASESICVLLEKANFLAERLSETAHISAVQVE